MAGASLFAYNRIDWLFGVLTVAALLVPFVGYIVALYSSPFLGKWRVLRVLLLTLFSFAVTIGGYLWLYRSGAFLTGRGYSIV